MNWQRGGKGGESAYLELRRDGLLTMLEIESLDVLEGWMQTKSTIYIQQGHDKDLDTMVNTLVTTKSREKTVTGKGPRAIIDPSSLLSELRIRKSESEISIMREAAIIASKAHIHAMRNTQGDLTSPRFNL